MPSFSFHREERLKSRKIIAGLFKDGQSFTAYPLRIVWTPTVLPQTTFPVQFALTVPKRAFPKANQRNQIRRQVREAYRLNKHILYQKLAASEGKDISNPRQYAVMVIYIAKEDLPFHSIEQATYRWIDILAKTINRGR